MKFIFKNKIILFCILFEVSLGIVVFSLFQKAKTFKVIFFDVGQGDAILIRTLDGQDILIDGGPDKTVVQKLGKFMPFYDRDIELMILTHPEKDHITGLITVLKRYKVKEIIISDVSKPTTFFKEWLKEVEKNKIPVKIAKEGDQIVIDNDTIFYVLHPKKEHIKRYTVNDLSLVLRLKYKQIYFLFTGDISKKIELELIREKEIKSDLLKVAHHGSYTSSDLKFLQEVKPEYAVISVGEKNYFGHPHKKVLFNLERIGSKILRTDKLGDIKFIIKDNQLLLKEWSFLDMLY